MKSDLTAKEIFLSGNDMAELLKTTLSKRASFKMRARGFSMTPFIMDGDILTISPFQIAPVGLGKVAAFSNPLNGKLVVHRIVRITGDGFLIKGDNIQEADGLIHKDNVLGIVTVVERNNRRIRFGLGKERFIIALISRKRCFSLIFLFWRYVPTYIRNLIKCRILT